MEPWIIGLIAVCVIGVAVILYGALHDRKKNQRRAEEMLAPPKRDIPQFHPDSPAPHYLSELQARRRSEDQVTTTLSRDDREEIKAQLVSEEATRLSVGFLSADFITDQSTQWAQLERPRVLICAEPVTSMREILPVLEKLAVSQTGLVLAGPAFSDEVRHTLEINAIQRTMALLAIAVDDPALLTTISGVVGATVLSRGDLQANYVRPTDLGRCRRWVSSAKESWIIAAIR